MAKNKRVFLSQDQLRRLQEVELELLLEFDRICRKHNIRYTLTGGTLLGAVRHGGFIPWDDDSDVAMLRTEYRKFVSVCEDELDKNRYYFQDLDHTKGYRWGYGKLRRKDTVFMREHQEHMPYEQGIFMDIFPRDSVPDGYIMERIHKLCCFIVRKLLWSRVGKYYVNKTYLKIWFAILDTVSQKWVLKAYHLLERYSRGELSSRVRTLTFPIPHRGKGYKRSWYSSYEDIMFEGHKLMVESGYKEWLKYEFGDYYKLPPKDQRKAHPVVEVVFPDDEKR